MDWSIVKQPSALLPLAMSCTAVAIVVGHIVFVGVARQADVGADAHLWQRRMVGQVPVVAYFVITWLPPESTAVTAVAGDARWRRGRRSGTRVGAQLVARSVLVSRQ